MSGALIVRGTRPPTPEENGDIDTLLKTTAHNAFPERVMRIFQQIQYACRFPKVPLTFLLPLCVAKVKTYANDPGTGPVDPKDTRATNAMKVTSGKSIRL